MLRVNCISGAAYVCNGDHVNLNRQSNGKERFLASAVPEFAKGLGASEPCASVDAAAVWIFSDGERSKAATIWRAEFSIFSIA